jgi:hypothetical protein
MRLTLRVALVFAAFIVTALPAAAHHAFSAEFDATKPVELQGIVTKVEWVSPHAWVWVDVKDETGKVTAWSFELGAPPMLLRNGWTKDSIKLGAEVTVAGYRARSGLPVASCRFIRTADGKNFFGGVPEGGGR